MITGNTHLELIIIAKSALEILYVKHGFTKSFVKGNSVRDLSKFQLFQLLKY